MKVYATRYAIAYCHRTRGIFYHAINRSACVFDRTSYTKVKRVLGARGPLNVEKIESRLTPAICRMLVKRSFLVRHPRSERQLVRKIIDDVVLKQVEFHSLYLVLTTACNFRCQYCFVMQNRGRAVPESMNMATVRRALDDYARHCTKTDTNYIIFYGGEPLLEAQIFIDAVQEIRRRDRVGAFGRGRTVIALNTNASLLNDDMARFLKRNNVRVSASLDGGRRAHDSARMTRSGGPTYDMVAAAIRRLERIGVDYIISLTIGRHNIHSFVRDVGILARRYPNMKLGFNFMFDYLGGGNPFRISAGRVLRDLNEFYQSDVGKCRVEGRYAMRLIALTRPYVPYLYCNASGRQMVVLPTGRVGPCHAFMGKGRAFSSSRDIRRASSSRLWGPWMRRSMLHVKHCQRCPYILLCGGGCAYNAVLEAGSVRARDSFNCRLTALLVKLYLQGITEEAESKQESGSGRARLKATRAGRMKARRVRKGAR